MTNIRVNHTTETIEIGKTFAKKASVYGSAEYKMLQEAKKENRGFRVIEIKDKKKTSGRNTDFINMQFIESYCTMKKDKDFLKKMNKWKETGVDFNGRAVEYSFFGLKKEFLCKYEELIKPKSNTKATNTNEDEIVDCRKAS